MHVNSAHLNNCCYYYGLLLYHIAINKLMCVSINSTASSPRPVLSGVPQGSILGPLLFLIFVNNLPAAISSLLLFADDMKCSHLISGLTDVHLFSLT